MNVLPASPHIWYSYYMLKLLIFDWDDTITTGGGLDLYARCYEKALNSAGVMPPYDQVKALVFELWGRTHHEVLSSLLATFNADPALIDQVMDNYNKSLVEEEFLSHITVIPWVNEALEELSHTYILCVASSGNPQVIKNHLIPRLAIPPVFAQIMTTNDLDGQGKGKPFPDLVLKILETQNIPREEALVIGDSKSDLAMAQAAGVSFIAVLTGQLTQDKANKLGIDTVLASTAELPAFLAK